MNSKIPGIVPRILRLENLAHSKNTQVLVVQSPQVGTANNRLNRVQEGACDATSNLSRVSATTVPAKQYSPRVSENRRERLKYVQYMLQMTWSKRAEAVAVKAENGVQAAV